MGPGVLLKRAAPPVSIGLPVRNGMPYLVETLESICRQTFEDFEVLICDNASTDATEEVARELVRCDARARYLRIEPDAGAPANFNRCVAETNGGLFTWAASDDRYLPRYIERCVDYLDAHGEHVMCVPSLRFIDEAGLPVGALKQPPELGSSDVAERLRSFLDRRSWYMVYGLVRREALARTGLFSASYGSDVTLMWEMLLRFSIGTLEEALVEYRRYEVKTAESVWQGTQPAGTGQVPRWVHIGMFKELLARCGREDLEPPTRGAGQRALIRWIASKPFRDLVVDDLRDELRRPGRRRNPVYEASLVASMALLRPGRGLRIVRRHQIMQRGR